MKGYLQRIAASAAKPQGNIHPVLGSIFSAAKHDRAAETLPHDAGFSFSTRDQPVTTNSEVPSISSAPQPAQASPLMSPTEERFPGAQVTQSVPVQSSFEPLIAPAEIAVEPRAVPAHIPSGEAMRPYQAPSRSRPSKAESGPHDADPEERVTFTRLATPQGTGDLRISAYTPRAAQTPFLPEARRQKPDPFSTSASTRRAPDEIQIHIGRIEVTAIPQAAPRPAAATARKSLNLDEYLKRRNGRTG